MDECVTAQQHTKSKWVVQMSAKQMVTRQQKNNFINTKDLALFLVCVSVCVFLYMLYSEDQ